MKHVNAVRSLMDEGKSDQAEKALENLLALGPSNVEALKIKAELYGKKGQMEEEAKIWMQIRQIDSEDEDAIEFINKLHLEDKERYLFTEIVKENGRRFFAYPKNLFQISFAGLIGCISFLYLSTSPQFDSKENVDEGIALLTISFMILVVVPWLSILYLYFKSLKTLTVSGKGIEICTRVKSICYNWDELKTVSISHNEVASDSDIKLVLIPKNDTSPKIEIDLNETTSSIKAKKQLLLELGRFCEFLSFDQHQDLATESGTILHF